MIDVGTLIMWAVIGVAIPVVLFVGLRLYTNDRNRSPEGRAKAAQMWANPAAHGFEPAGDCNRCRNAAPGIVKNVTRLQANDPLLEVGDCVLWHKNKGVGCLIAAVPLPYERRAHVVKAAEAAERERRDNERAESKARIAEEQARLEEEARITAIVEARLKERQEESE